MGSDQCLVTSGLHEDHAGMFSGWELNVECGTTALIQHTTGQTRKRVGMAASLQTESAAAG